MNKKGIIDEKIFTFLFYTILAIIIGSILLLFIMDLREDTTFKLKGISIDSAFLMDAIYFSQNDLAIKLTYPEEDFFVTFNKQPCLIKVSTIEQYDYINYRCFSQNDFSESKIQTPFLEIQKIGNDLTIK